MRIKKILFFTIFMILCIGMLNSCNGENSSNGNLDFTYNETSYSIDVKQIAKEKNINIEDYPYYVVGMANDIISIYYSQHRIYSGVHEERLGYDKLYGSKSTLRMLIKKDGSISGSIVDFSSNTYSLSLSPERFIASNQDIFYHDTLIFNRNHGVEYDSSGENQKVCDDVMRVTDKIQVYEKPRVNYNEISTLSADSVVKRVAYSVNTANKHTWDKIILSNGTEGYVFAENLEMATEYKNIKFEYDNKKYDVYFSPSKYGIDLEDYPYYVIGMQNDIISIYYSQHRIYSGVHEERLGYDKLYGSKSTLRMLIKKDGSISGGMVDFSSNNYSLSLSPERFIASNQDIFYHDTLIFNRNHGVEYDSSGENQKVCDDVMRVTDKIKVYEKPGVNYNEISTLSADSVVKRVAYSVNTANKHTWDKIILSNGTEGYVFAENLEMATEYKNIKFEYDNKKYDVYFLPSEYGIDLEDYPYYVIGMDNDIIYIYYSQRRISSDVHQEYLGYDKLYGSKSALRMLIKKDGSISGGMVDFSSNNYSLTLYPDRFIASNQDIFYNETLIFKRNHGVEYDSSVENQKVCDDVMRVTDKIKVYEKPGVNYNEISTLSADSVVKRVAYSVNTANKHTWDKIILSNGTEGYVFAENLEMATEYKNIKFEYDNKKYDVYFSPSKYGIDLEDYPYYVVGMENDIIYICYSQKRIYSGVHEERLGYDKLYGSKSTLRMLIKKDGSISGGMVDFSSNNYSLSLIPERFIASNQNIFYHDTLIFNRNHGYIEADFVSSNNLYFSTDSDCFYTIDANAEINIIEGELEYNSVPLSEEERNIEIKKKNLGIELSSLAYNAMMKDAANNLLYFLTSGELMYTKETGNIYSYKEGYYKTGHTAKEILFDNAIRDMNEPKETLNNSINSMIEAAENLITKTTDSQPIHCYTEINGQCPAPNLDWFMAVYNYRTRCSAVVSREGDSYSMSFKYTMIDYYDWESTDGILNWDPYIGTQTEFSKLNKYGLSRNYTNYDVLNYKVTWTKGQNVGSGAIVSGPGL